MPAVAEGVDLLLRVIGIQVKLPRQVGENSASGRLLLGELDDPPLIVKELADPDRSRHVVFSRFGLTEADMLQVFAAVDK